MSPKYQAIKTEILETVKAIRTANPKAAEYLEQHLVFDDEKETFTYTGDGRLKLTPFEG